MAKINIGAFDSALGRLMSIPMDSGGLVPELAQELSAVLVLENDRPEWCYLKGEKCSQAYVNAPQTGAQSGLVRFRNPATSSTLMVISQILCSTNPAAAGTSFGMALAIGRAAADLGNVVASKSPRDGRLFGDAPAAVLSYDVAGAAISGVTCEFQGANIGTISCISPPIILDPGGSVDVQSQIVNLQFFVNFAWMERELRVYESRR